MEKHTVVLVRKAEDAASTVQVFLDGREIRPSRSQRVINHSPDGFNAGFGGSGPAQTALAIMLELTDQKTAVQKYQDFKWTYLAKSEYQNHGRHEFTFTLEEIGA